MHQPLPLCHKQLWSEENYTLSPGRLPKDRIKNMACICEKSYPHVKISHEPESLSSPEEAPPCAFIVTVDRQHHEQASQSHTHYEDTERIKSIYIQALILGMKEHTEITPEVPKK